MAGKLFSKSKLVEVTVVRKLGDLQAKLVYNLYFFIFMSRLDTTTTILGGIPTTAIRTSRVPSTKKSG